MALTQEQVTLISVAAFGVAPGKVHSNYFLDSDAAGKFFVGGTDKQIHEVLGLKEPLTGTAAVAAVLEHEYNYLVSTNGLEKVSDAEFVKNVAKNLGAEDSKTLAVDLASGMSRYDALAKFAEAEADKAGGIEKVAGIITAQESNKTIDNAVKDLVDSAVKPDTPNKPTDPVNTIPLEDGRDTLEGTANNDLFDATAGQNQNGTIANAFATGDKLDGAGGYNTLEATVVQDFNADSGAPIDIRANTKNIQEVHFEAVGGSPVTVQATRMANVEQYWSNFSDENLTVSDISLQGANLNVTKDVTFGLKDVRAGAGLEAYFDSNSLINAGTDTSNSQLVIRIADVSTETPATPLANVNMNLSFVLGGKSHELTDLRSTDGSYAGLVAAANAKLAEIGLGRVEASLTDAYNSVTFAGNTVNLPFTANVVMLTDPEGAEFGDVNFTQNAIAPVTGGFLVAGNAEPFDPNIATTLIESNLVLDNAGRGSLAGDVVIGGMSNSGKVVEKLNLSVDRDSKIDGLHTGFNAVSGAITPRAFKEIEVTSTGAKGNLEIGEFGGLDGKTFVGAVGASGIQDAKMFNASNFEGTSLKVAGTATSNDAYSYTTAGSKDVVHVNVNAENSASSKFSLSVNTGAGNDVIYVVADQAGSKSQFSDHSDLMNITVNAGAGDDQIWLGTKDAAPSNKGYGAAKVDASTGNDLVVTDGGGKFANFLINANQAISSAKPSNWNSSVDGLGNNKANMFKTMVKVEFIGIESQWVLIDSADYKTSSRQINDAIKKAISESNELSKLLDVSDVRDEGLVVSSIVDRALAADGSDFNISFMAPRVGTVNEATLAVDNAKQQVVTQSDLQKAWAAYTGNDLSTTGLAIDTDAAILTTMVGVTSGLEAGAYNVDASRLDNGINSTSLTMNEVEGGAGDDVLVLSSNQNDGNDTVVFKGQFGNDTLVNFNTDTGGGKSSDVLDFTDYLSAKSNDMNASSNGTNVVDQKVAYAYVDATATTLAQGTTASNFLFHNTVNLTKFSTVFGQVTTAAGKLKTSDDLDEADVKAALEAVNATVGGFTSANVGMKSVLLVTNDQVVDKDGALAANTVNANEISQVFTVTIAAVDAAGKVTYTVEKQGSIQLAKAFSDFTNIDAKHIMGTADQVANQEAIADKIAPTEAPSEEPTEEPTDPELPANSVSIEAVVGADGIANVNFAGTEAADVFTVTLNETAAGLDLGQITITDFGANDQLVLSNVYEGGFDDLVDLGGAFLPNPVSPAEINSEGHLELALMKAIDVENADIDVWTITFENADETIIEKALAGDFADWLLF